MQYSVIPYVAYVLANCPQCSCFVYVCYVGFSHNCHARIADRISSMINLCLKDQDIICHPSDVLFDSWSPYTGNYLLLLSSCAVTSVFSPHKIPRMSGHSFSLSTIGPLFCSCGLYILKYQCYL